MTNYEWVKENQKDVVREALVSNMKLHTDKVANTIIHNDDVIKEAIIARCDIDMSNDTIVPTTIKHLQVCGYSTSCKAVAEWLDKEREIPLLYPIGTAVIDPNGEVWFYNGRGKYSMRHCYVPSIKRIGQYCDRDNTIPKGAEYEDEEAKMYLKPIKFGDVKVVDNYVNAKGEE